MNRIDQRDITHKGRKLTVTVVRDDDGDPRTDGDCYTPEDIAAWQRDEWQYVTVAIMDGSEIIDSLSGVEFGAFGSWNLDMDYMIETHPVPDMLVSIAGTVPIVTPDTVIVPVGTIAELITRARDDYQSGLEREAATWTAAVALIVSTDPARMTGVVEYLGFAITTEQPVSVDRVAAEHAIRLGASS